MDNTSAKSSAVIFHKRVILEAILSTLLNLIIHAGYNFAQIELLRYRVKCDNCKLIWSLFEPPRYLHECLDTDIWISVCILLVTRCLLKYI